MLAETFNNTPLSILCAKNHQGLPQCIYGLWRVGIEDAVLTHAVPSARILQGTLCLKCHVLTLFCFVEAHLLTARCAVDLQLIAIQHKEAIHAVSNCN